MYIGIAHGVGYVVRFCRTPDINLQAQADGKLIAYHGFLFAHAVMGKEAKGVKENYNWSLLVDCFLQTY